MKNPRLFLAHSIAGLMTCLIVPALPAAGAESSDSSPVHVAEKEQTITQEVPRNSGQVHVNQELRVPQFPSRTTRSSGLALGGGQMGGRYGTAAGGGLDLFIADRADTGRSFIYTVSEMDAKTREQLQEDLAVMSLLLKKSLQKEVGASEDSPLKLNLFSGDQPLKNIYLEGFGALFFLNVKFPLRAPAQEEPEEETTTSNPSEWDQARQELYGGSDDVLAWRKQPYTGYLGVNTIDPYKQEKVEKLQETIIQAMANATNIKALKPTETVVVAVTSPVGTAMKTVHSSVSNSGHNTRNTVIVNQEVSAGKKSGITTLTLSARKSDIEDFATHKTALDEFRKKVTIRID